MTESMSRCEQCGTALAPGLRFCPECGQPVAQARFCEQCGAKLAAGLRFCESCGSPVDAPAAAAEPFRPQAAAPAWQAEPAPAAWTPPEEAAAEVPRPRRRRRGRACLWTLLALVLLIVGAVAAAYLTGWLQVSW